MKYKVVDYVSDMQAVGTRKCVLRTAMLKNGSITVIEEQKWEQANINLTDAVGG